jgi:hypothetical protein
VSFSLSKVLLVIAAPLACLSQTWEVGGAGGYGWYINPTISNPSGSVQAGFPPRAALGAVFGNEMYQYLGGEIRYLFRFGGPELKLGGVISSMSGYTNLIDYDLLIHMRPRDVKLRPFFAGGAGIKVFTGTERPRERQMLPEFARLTPETEVEPVISAGAGVKYRFTRHAQFRIDFRTYFSPLPNHIFRTPASAATHGWVFDYVPMAGISYVF